jgi:hypothetical protein
MREQGYLCFPILLGYFLVAMPPHRKHSDCLAGLPPAKLAERTPGSVTTLHHSVDKVTFGKCQF